MAKRHIIKTKKQELGQYYTTNVDELLSGWEHLVKGKKVADVFAGGNDLLDWATKNGATEIKGFDIDPQFLSHIKHDTLLYPPDIEDYFSLTNPPYLSKNKSKGNYAEIYDKWEQNDLYKCHLATLKKSKVKEGIEIIPTNFFSESRPAARNMFFKDYSIVEAKYWTMPSFEDATTGITVFHYTIGGNEIQEFPITFYPKDVTEVVTLKRDYNYLWGEEFFNYIDVEPIKITKTDVGMKEPNTKLVLGLLDAGKWKQGLTYNDGEPFYCQPKTFTTYQMTINSGINLSDDAQREIVEIFNDKLSYYREKYHGMFLSNFMGANQKILSRDYCHKLLTRIINDLGLRNKFIL